MHDLHAWKFHLIYFFYRFRFTRFWHMNHTASLKLDLCSIGLGHSFALSLRKTSDKRCNSNCNKKQLKRNIMCNICTIFWRIWFPSFPSGIYIGFLEYSFGVYIWCDLDVHALLLRSLSPSQVLAFHRGLSFLHSTLRLDVKWLLQHNLLFGCAFLESFTHQQTVKVKTFKPMEPCEASRKTCPHRIFAV